MQVYITPPPENEQVLLSRAHAIAGCSLATIAARYFIDVPHNLTRQKGWVGQLLERVLGANAGSRAECDFAHLGIELKSIPVNQYGRPLETTFVCVAPLMNNSGVIWQTSYVKHKLSKVLWIPVEGDRALPVGERRVGKPILWQPTTLQNRQLEQDWNELMDMISLGQVEQITARHGAFLQIRPKALNGQALTEAIGLDGRIILTRPRGFYLKKNFTTTILQDSVQSSKFSGSL